LLQAIRFLLGRTLRIATLQHVLRKRIKADDGGKAGEA
jgi:hypothetical protein